MRIPTTPSRRQVAAWLAAGAALAAGPARAGPGAEPPLADRLAALS